ncbi:hypothetical protein [Nesterenkonia massiliensis]|uniref:hypothetical protein n=1 Tax=Nesterenkonia massiliensis TaxID=1232429 RepID=UPI0005C8E839|nr:hypothetical protein [Nesterenkonia massiliensis]
MLFTASSPAPEIIQITVGDSGGDWWPAFAGALVGGLFALAGSLLAQLVANRNAKGLQAKAHADAAELQKAEAADAQTLQRSTELARYCDCLLQTLRDAENVDPVDVQHSDWDFGYRHERFREDYHRYAARILMWSEDKTMVRDSLDRLHDTLTLDAVSTAQAGAVADLKALDHSSLNPFADRVREALLQCLGQVRTILIGLPTGDEAAHCEALDVAVVEFMKFVADEVSKYETTSVMFFVPMSSHQEVLRDDSGTP